MFVGTVVWRLVASSVVGRLLNVPGVAEAADVYNEWSEEPQKGIRDNSPPTEVAAQCFPYSVDLSSILTLR